ncbi:MAG: site-specific integrase [Candidatus Thermoplasmatota archaeon]|jgi:hypothetical protein|nr:site-specific integrase [Candidatus Thermoplasmatota archaeon]MCL5984064.1 site-specific integrase [Candidatus Thermoplasmatota archaeon]
MARKLKPGSPPRFKILEDPEVRRWYNNVAQGSQVTADVFVRRLGAVCDRLQMTPAKFLTLSDTELYNMMLDFVTAQQKEGFAGTYIGHSLVVVRSWLAHNGRQITRKIKIRGAYANPTIADERIPSQDELHRIFLAATVRDRVCSSLMAHSGVRPEVLGNYLGDDGLRVKDFPDLKIEGGRVEFGRIPTMVVVRAELSKAGHRYFTFLGEEGCHYLKNYLEERLRQGEKLTPDSDMISSRWETGKTFIRTISVGNGIRRAIRSAGYRWRPYVLRAYFDTQLLLAESKGKVAHDYRVFWMGHKGSMEARYTVNKGRLPPDLISDMRDAYARCEPFLSTISGGQREDVPKEVAKAMLQLAGFDEEEIEKMDLNDLVAIRDQVRDRLGASDAPRQEVVSIGEVPQRLAAGWQFVAALGTTQAIVTSPSSRGTSPTPTASALPLRVVASPAPPAGPTGVGGSRGGGLPTASGGAGPSLPPQVPPSVSGRPGEGPLREEAAHRMQPHRGSPEEDSPELR